MKKFQYILFLVMLTASFTSTFAQSDDSNPEDIKGRWMLTSVSAFADPASLPEYNYGDYVWDFGNGEGNGNRMNVIKGDGDIKEDNFALPSGEYPFWARKCLLKIDEQTYHIRFDNSTSPDGKAMPTRMYLDTSLDPRIADGGYVLVLMKME